MKEKLRIDKFLWAVRIFKTRSQAAEACRKGHIYVNDVPVKPSKEIKVSDIIKVKHKVIYRQYRILELTDKRLGAKLVGNYIEEITPEEDLLKLKMYYEALRISKPTFKGRPTKKARRDIERFLRGGERDY